jgi:lipoprotein NlpI
VGLLVYPTVGALVVLAVLAVVVGRQNRDLLRVKAYRDFVVRLIPVLSTAVFVAGMPFIVNLADANRALPVLLVYLGGAALLTALMARAVDPEERRAGAAFKGEDYERSAILYGKLIERHPLPRYYSALGAALDLNGDQPGALESMGYAIERDPKLGVAYFNRASTLAALGMREAAVDDLRAVFQSDSGRRVRQAAEEALKELGTQEDHRSR